MRPAIIFDDGLPDLAPLTDLRPAFDIRTGALTTLSRLARALNLSVLGVVVPAPLVRLAEIDPDSGDRRAVAAGHPPAVSASGDVLLLSGRCPLPHDQIEGLSPREALTEAGTGHLIAAVVTADRLRDWDAARPLEGLRVVGQRPAPALLSRPWHLRTFRDRCLAADLSLLQDSAPAAGAHEGVAIVGAPDAVTIAPSARVYPGVILDAEPGPIVIDDHALIRPGA